MQWNRASFRRNFVDRSCGKPAPQNAKRPEPNRRLERHLGDKGKWEAAHGKLSSFHPVEQRLHAGDERSSVAAADHGNALTRRNRGIAAAPGGAVPFEQA